MARVRIHDSQMLGWKTAVEIADPEMLSTLNEEELGTEVLHHEPGGEDHPQLFEVRFPANMVIELHAHHEDEIIYVAGGLMKVGPRSLGPGSSIFVKGRTLYSFTAGEEGLHILNFRPRRDNSYVKKSAFLEARASH